MRTAALRILGTVLLAAAAIGCGPSTGGTGTGASLAGLQAFNATPQSLCTSALAQAAGCATTSAGAPRAPVFFASATGEVRATVEGDDIVVDAPCRGLVFEGTWAASATLGSRFYGAIVVSAPASDLVPASAAVQPGSTSDAVDLTLRDAAEQVLVAPTTLLRVSALPAPTCR